MDQSNLDPGLLFCLSKVKFIALDSTKYRIIEVNAPSQQLAARRNIFDSWYLA